jgi:integrase
MPPPKNRRLGDGILWNKGTGQLIVKCIRPGTRGYERKQRTFKGIADENIALSVAAQFRQSAFQNTGEPSREMGLQCFVDSSTDALFEECSAVTRINSLGWLKNLVAYFGEKPLRDIDADDIRELRLWMKRTNRSAATVNIHVRFLRKILGHAKRKKIIDQIPEFPRVLAEHRREAMTPVEQEAFFKAFESPYAMAYDDFRRSKGFFLAAVLSGLSRGDLMALRWSHVKLDANPPVISTTRHKTGVAAVVGILPELGDVLLEARRDSVNDGVHAFCSSSGRPYSLTTVLRYFRKAKELAGITRKCEFHCLRHTFTSNRVEAGVPLGIIQQELGHKTLRMLERYSSRERESAVSSYWSTRIGSGRAKHSTETPVAVLG